ncbi:MAG: TolC family protein [Bacteroidota bacterium]|nr:TolC family protein [Bacteroidota bacterium]
MKTISALLFLLMAFTPVFAQEILNQYVNEAIKNNLLIREKKTNELRQGFQLEEASRMWGPEVNFQANYTLAAGGRNIELPVGKLLNPVYSNLNELTENNQFPMIEDESIHFLPNNFHDVKFRITQPILRPEIKYNKWIKAEEVDVAELQTAQTIRELTKDVKTAYLQWLQAQEAIKIIDQGLALLNENKRITESLIRNGMAIPSGRMRIESDIEVLKAKKQKVQSDVKNAAAYFNFLLHRDKEASIIPDTLQSIPSIPSLTVAEDREELLQIKKGMRIQDLALSLEEKHFAPTLGVQLDIGSQAYGVDWGGYVLGGVGLEIPIWDNKKSNLRRQEWKASLEAHELNYAWTKSAFDIQLESEIENLKSDITIYDSYTLLLASNQRYYDETVRRYKEGLASYIELLDARTQVTQTQIEQNLAKFQSWIRMINIERIAASTPIN